MKILLIYFIYIQYFNNYVSLVYFPPKSYEILNFTMSNMLFKILPNVDKIFYPLKPKISKALAPSELTIKFKIYY